MEALGKHRKRQGRPVRVHADHLGPRTVPDLQLHGRQDCVHGTCGKHAEEGRKHGRGRWQIEGLVEQRARA